MHQRDVIRWTLLSLLLTGGARAQSSEARVVWYRASNECPQGPDFIGRLAERSNLARLAEAGDHIDFVVTLLSADGETVGRLERQTEGGTVAIRELRDPSCPRVADALAFSLALSLDPSKRPAAPSEPAAENATPTVTAASPRPAAPEIVRKEPAARTLERDPSRVSEMPARKELRGGWLGLQGGALTGIAPRALTRTALFVSIEDPWPGWLKASSLRVAAVGALGSAPTSIGPIRRWLLAARAEGCPLRWGRPAVGVAPCLAFELGATGASGDETSAPRDTGLWAAAAAGLRGALQLLPALMLEAQAEAELPLYRNDVYAGREAVYRAQSVAFQGGLGISLRLW